MSEEEKSYSSILKSSSIMGGAQGFNLLLGMLRVKFIAVLIGPAGVGLLGIFHSIQNIASTASGLGINSSGVREVAEAAGTENTERISRAIVTLRRLCWLTGVAGCLLIVALAIPISQLTFDSDKYAGHIACLGLSVLMGSVAAGQMALLQGMRRIGDLARINVISSIAGTIVAIVFYSWLGLQGIVPAILTISAFMLTVSFWYSRRVKVAEVKMTWKETIISARSLILLGLVFMWAALMTGLAEYATVSLITNYINLAAVGIFSAAFRLSGMFLNFILGAMGADFYPRLTAASDNHEKMRSLVNHQTEIGLLLAVPGLLATLVLAPWLITIFYTESFSQSAQLLQWFILGCLGRVVSWPMGFVMLAKGAGRLYLFTETIFHITHLLLIWLGLQWFGVLGVAIAFSVLNLLYPLMVMAISRHLIEFKWTASVKKLLYILLSVVVVAILQNLILPIITSTIIGGLFAVIAGIYCLRELCNRLGSDHTLVTKIGMIPGAGKLIRS